MSSAPNKLTLAEVIENAITRCYPNDWDREDFITGYWLKELRDQFGQRAIPWVGGLKVIFDCLKLGPRHSMEQRHGDVGFLVKITAPNMESVTGFASLEAKRSYPGNPYEKYPEYSDEQLRREFAHSPMHRLLLYSHTPFAHLSGKHAAVLPAATALLCAADATILDSVGGSLAAQVARYLQGWDLDFTKATVDRVLDGETSYRHLLRAHIGLTRNIALDLAQIRLSSGLYVDIDTPEQAMDVESPEQPLPDPPPQRPRTGGHKR